MAARKKQTKADNDNRKITVAEWRGGMTEAMKTVQKQQDEMDQKLDELLQQRLVTEDRLAGAIQTHSTTCPKGTPSANPRQTNSQVIRENGKLLAIISGLVGLTTILGQAVMMLVRAALANGGS
jgi:hypothetical protein